MKKWLLLIGIVVMGSISTMGMTFDLFAQSLTTEQRAQLINAANAGTLPEVVSMMISRDYRKSADITAAAVEISPGEANETITIAFETLLKMVGEVNASDNATADSGQNRSMGVPNLPLPEAYSPPDASTLKKSPSKGEDRGHYLEGDKNWYLPHDETNPA